MLGLRRDNLTTARPAPRGGARVRAGDPPRRPSGAARRRGPFRGRRIVRSGLLAGLALAISCAAHADFSGEVVAVTDGDTITVLDAGKTRRKVRLAGIDAPERGQPGGYRSKESLSQLVYARRVRVEDEKNDPYGRIVGKVWVAPAECPSCGATVDAGLAQIELGRAWWYRQYAHEQSPEDRARYAAAEREARASRAGLWRDPNPVPPWDWRSLRRR
jgi:endonuclease YncB( thermonuclease family)